MYGGRIAVPPSSKFLSLERIVTVMKMASAHIYRTASTLDYESHCFEPMGTSASDVRITHRFTVLEDEKTHEVVAQREVNQKYNMTDKKSPLWNIHVVGPSELLTGIHATSDDFVFPKFYIFWSFHHCISDGLSGWAFIREFMARMGPECFQVDPPAIQDIPIVTRVPPLIDNLIRTNWIELFPGTLILVMIVYLFSLL